MVADKKPEKLKLKSEVGLLGGVSLIAGVIIGSGIFMSPQYVLLYIGSPGASLLIWAASGLLAMAASFCYAELGTVICESGGEYVYILRTSGNVVAFMFSFTTNLVMRPTGTIAVALTFAQNLLASFYDDCPPPDVAVKCLAAAGIVMLTAMNCMNVRSSMAVTVFFTAVKILALLVILIGGIVLLIQGNTSSSLQQSFEGTKLGVSGIAMGFYQCLWSYDGWNTLNYINEEIKHPQENGSNAEILNSLKYVRPGEGYQPTFTILEKCDVNGKDEHPVFSYLKNKLPYPVDDPVSFMQNPTFLVWNPVSRNDVSWNLLETLYI